jgi:hypothetical protein
LKIKSPFSFYTGQSLISAITGNPINSLGNLLPGTLDTDNVLYQYYEKPRNVKRATIFSGESIEAERIEEYTHRVIKKPPFSFSSSSGFDLETK